jgi:hypothetical protein
VFAGDMLNKGGRMIGGRKQRVTLVVPRDVLSRQRIEDVSYRNADRIVLEGAGITVEVEDVDKFVEVQFLDPHPVRGTLSPPRELFTYQVPEGMTLKVGDIVDVPTMYQPRNRAIVRKVDSNNLPNAVNHRFVSGVLMRAR